MINGEFCSKNMSGSPTSSNITAETNHIFATALLYDCTSSTIGGFVNVKKPTVFFYLRLLIPMYTNISATTLHITNPIIIMYLQKNSKLF